MRNRQWTLAELQRLGTVPDGRLAEEFGVSRQLIQTMRQKRGIPRCGKRVYKRGTSPRGGAARRWTREEVERLGTAPDGRLAREFGRTVEAVRSRRRQAGIPPFNCPVLRAQILREANQLSEAQQRNVLNFIRQITGRVQE